MISELFTVIAKALLGKVVADEFFSTTDAIAHWILRRAIARLADSHRARYAEEWLCVLSDTPTPLRRLFRATSLYLGADQMAREANQRAASHAKERSLSKPHAKTIRIFISYSKRNPPTFIPTARTSPHLAASISRAVWGAVKGRVKAIITWLDSGVG